MTSANGRQEWTAETDRIAKDPAGLSDRSRLHRLEQVAAHLISGKADKEDVPGPYAVILTGGALPGAPAGGVVHRLDIDLAIDNAGYDPADPPAGAVPIAEEAFELGYKRAAADHRIVALWIIDGDRAEAEAFAKFVTAEVDPAYVRHAASPLAELLNYHAHQRASHDE